MMQQVIEQYIYFLFKYCLTIYLQLLINYIIKFIEDDNYDLDSKLILITYCFKTLTK